MMNTNISYIAFQLLLLCISTHTFSQSALMLGTPKMFIKLDSTCATPDAMAFDASGNIYLSVTNATTFDKFGAKIIKLNREGKILKTWTSLSKHPATGKVHPMGMAFGTDGYLYIADNQSFAGQKHVSRVLRARLVKGDLQKFETVVSGLNVANGLRFYKGYVYVTDAWTDNARKSGVFRFSIAELNKRPVTINAANRPKYLLHEMELDTGVDDGVGFDGMDFDNHGNLYVGNFSNGMIARIYFKENATVPTIATLATRNKMLIGCDGIFFDEHSNSLLIANFLENSVLQYSLTEKKLTTLWSNKDAACNADLDSPCDLAVIGNKLVVVNFDTYTTNANKTIDKCNTVSVFEITR